jgi:uncharacterized protein (DUF885 family)
MELGRDAAPFDYGDNTLASAMSESATPYVVSQQGGAYSAGPEFLDSAHKIETAADAEAYLARVHEIGRVMGQETDRIRRDAGKGVVAPDFILSNTVRQQEGILAVPAAQARLVSPWSARHGKRASPAIGQPLPGDRRRIYPALSTQLATLKGLQPKSTHDAGVWRLPNGEAYRWLLREYLHLADAGRGPPDGLEQNKAIRRAWMAPGPGLTQGSVGERMTALARIRSTCSPTPTPVASSFTYLNGLISGVRPQLSKAFT